MQRVAAQSLQHLHDSPRRMRLRLVRRAPRIDTERRGQGRVHRHHRRGNGAHRDARPHHASEKIVVRAHVQHLAPPRMTAQDQRMAISRGMARSGSVPTPGRTGASIRRSTPIHESTAPNIARAASAQCAVITARRGSHQLRLRMQRKRSTSWPPRTGPQRFGDSSMRSLVGSHGLHCR